MLTAIMRRIFKRCVDLQISLRAEHVPGSDMKDAGVDSLSRWGEFKVRRAVFKKFDSDKEWGGESGYTCDLYASAKSTQVKGKYGA